MSGKTVDTVSHCTLYNILFCYIIDYSPTIKSSSGYGKLYAIERGSGNRIGYSGVIVIDRREVNSWHTALHFLSAI